MIKKEVTTKKITVKGKVQGVGFRPFVYRTALKYNLKGYVLNDTNGVEIIVQGNTHEIIEFEKEIIENPPSISEIVEYESFEISPFQKFNSFTIKKSKSADSHDVLISPDIAICEDCLKELFDPDDKRYLFPFINCTNCGPRFTITKTIPYDRINTSMACFKMCHECYNEYSNPLDRRFHAQPNCCSRCGPRIYLLNKDQKLVCEGVNSLEYLAKELINGQIVALKGLGGFHISCIAYDKDIVQRLRELKKRPYKPFALMVSNIEDAKKIAFITKEEEDILTGNIRPIVLVKSKNGILPKEIAPDTDKIGLMLPYTPLHYILFHFFKQNISEHIPPVLIMTSGNKPSHPICTGNREAVGNLQDFVNYFLIHNRDILIRCDDSVVAVLPNKKILYFRRARGFVPSPIFLKKEVPAVLGVGAELKNTICLTKKNTAFVSQYIGDLKNLETYKYFQETIDHFKDILKVRPMAIGADLHPDYLSTRYAQEQDNLPVIKIQHHHAHILSVMAENKIEDEVIGISMDGLGLGTDNTIWGGEILFINKDLSFDRIGHLYPIKLPGKEAAIKEIWRIALSFLFEINEDIEFFITDIPLNKKELITHMLKNNINCIPTSSCGRLFDAISSLLGIKHMVTYEGEGAIALESIQDKSYNGFYEIPINKINGKYIIDSPTLIKEIIKDLKNNTSPNVISRKFHKGLCQAITSLALTISKETEIKKIALSGGVFQNKTLIFDIYQQLKKLGLKPLTNIHIPPNDENISLGQAYYVSNKIE